jgi:hypothetical protein
MKSFIHGVEPDAKTLAMLGGASGTLKSVSHGLWALTML